MLDVLLTTAVLVALTEIGDKTQMALLALSMRTRQPHKIFTGMAISYAIVGVLVVLFGNVLGSFVSRELVRLLTAATFMLIGGWMLYDERRTHKKIKTTNPLLAAFLTVQLAEFADKSQLTAAALAVQYRVFWPVFLGYLLGIYFTEAVTIFGGDRIADRLPVQSVNRVSALLFFVFGFLALTKPF